MRDNDDPVASLLFGALCFVAAVAAVVWAGAALATVVVGHGVLGVGIADAARAAVALPDNFTHPAHAWPSSAAEQVPGPWIYWPATLRSGRHG